MSYNPIPPRTWSRVQNACSTIASANTNADTSLLKYGLTIAQINKGNVLQYKANSSKLTKQQIYSLMAKGMWTNRNTTWATQSQSYSNPNTHSFKRSGSVNITIDGTPTSLPVTCPIPPNINNTSLPSTSSSSGPSAPPLPPSPPEPTPSGSGPVSIPLQPVEPVEPIVIQDEGSLLCSIIENICTGETIVQPRVPNCHPTTDSDVPGKIEELCWSNNIQTWYPRQRLTMNNSTDKWPINYKGFTSALKPYTPYLTISVDTANCSKTILSWTYQIASCLPVDTILIYVIDNSQTILSSELIATVDPANNSYSLSLVPGNYTIFIKTVSGGIESQQSNSVSVALDTFYVIISNTNAKLTTFIKNGYKAFIVECDESPEFGISKTCSAQLYGCISRSDISFLIIGAGGGGSCGYNKDNDPEDKNGSSGGGGGAGGGSVLINNYTNPISTIINLQIGVGGGGHTPGNAGFGASAGNGGTNSFINDGTNIYTAYGGGAGYGIGATIEGGGIAGNATSPVLASAYGGGGGGGAFSSQVRAVNIGGAGGIGTLGTNGSNGSAGNNTSAGGYGGNSTNNPLLTPFGYNIYLSQGGEGGSINVGGSAGNSLTLNTSIGGQNSDYGLFSTYGVYGNGGGGGSGVNSINNIGGNGGNGAIMIWHPVP